jgi:hypothetical protein
VHTGPDERLIPAYEQLTGDFTGFIAVRPGPDVLEQFTVVTLSQGRRR